MPPTFNAYHEWLGLLGEITNPSYYEILGLDELEPDPDKIAQAGDRALARVRGFRPGAHAKEWSRLLDEISSAKRCLLDPPVKLEYDRCLRSGSKRSAAGANEQKSDAPSDRSPIRTPADADRFPPGMAPPGAAKSSAVQPQPTESPRLPPATTTDEPFQAVDHLLPPGAPQSAMPSSPIAAAMAPIAGWQVPRNQAPPPGTVGFALPVSTLPVNAAPSAPVPQPTWQSVPFGAPTQPAAYAPMAMPVGYASPPGPTASTFQADPMAPAAAPLAGPIAPASPATPVAPLPEPKVGLAASSVAVVQARRARQSQRNLLVAVIAGCLLVLAGVVVFVNRVTIFSKISEQVAQVPRSQQPVDTSGANLEPLPRVVESSVPKKPVAKPEPQPGKIPEPTPMPETTGNPPAANHKQEPKSEPPMPAPMPEPPESKPETKPEPTTGPKPEQKPEPEVPVLSPEPMPPPMPTKAELIALGKALRAARDALGKQHFEEADAHIAQAESLAKLPEHQEMAARLKEVASYVKQFRNAVEQGVKGLEVGAQIKVGTSTMVIVVQVSPERLTIRRAGGNVTYSTGELPPGLAMALAESWLNANDPVNRVIKGSYFAVAPGDADTNREKAKKYWDEAQSGGVDIKHLLPFLTDHYDLEKQVEQAAKPPAKPADAKPADTKPKE
jgi:hypothetical protein